MAYTLHHSSCSKLAQAALTDQTTNLLYSTASDEAGICAKFIDHCQKPHFARTWVYIIKYLTLLMMLVVLPLNANIVDVWQFSSEANEVRAIELAKQLRCPQCQNQNLVESTSPIAKDLRLEVYQLVDEGKTDSEIIALMTSRFGDFVLYNPKFNYDTWLLWLMPFFMIVIGGLYCWKQIRKRRYDADLNEEQQKKLQWLLQQNNSDVG